MKIGSKSSESKPYLLGSFKGKLKEWKAEPCLNEYAPFLENIRGEPRFLKLMERVKHKWETFEPET